MVLRYSSRERRRYETVSPSAAWRPMSASVSCAVIWSATRATSAGLGRACFFGGMSPLLMRSMTSIQCPAAPGFWKSRARVSRRRSPFCFFSPWQSRQCASRKGFTTASNSRTASAGVATATWAVASGADMARTATNGSRQRAARQGAMPTVGARRTPEAWEVGGLVMAMTRSVPQPHRSPSPGWGINAGEGREKQVLAGLQLPLGRAGARPSRRLRVVRKPLVRRSGRREGRAPARPSISRFHRADSSPRSYARATASARPATPSLVNTALRWLLMVSPLTPSARPRSSLDSPRPR